MEKREFFDINCVNIKKFGSSCPISSLYIPKRSNEGDDYLVVSFKTAPISVLINPFEINNSGGKNVENDETSWFEFKDISPEGTKQLIDWDYRGKFLVAALDSVVCLSVKERKVVKTFQFFNTIINLNVYKREVSRILKLDSDRFCCISSENYGMDFIITVFSFSKGRLLLELKKQHISPVSDIVKSKKFRNEIFIAYGERDKFRVKLFNSKKLQILHSYRFNYDEIFCIQSYLNVRKEEILVCCGREKTLKFYNTSTNMLFRDLRCPSGKYEGESRFLNFSVLGNWYIFSGDSCGELTCFDLRKDVFLKTKNKVDSFIGEIDSIRVYQVNRNDENSVYLVYTGFRFQEEAQVIPGGHYGRLLFRWRLTHHNQESVKNGVLACFELKELRIGDDLEMLESLDVNERVQFVIQNLESSDRSKEEYLKICTSRNSFVFPKFFC